jgi:phage terminase small subunit
MALTAKQLRFVSEYLLDLNATQAAVREGYSEASAHAQGHRLLKDAEVAAAVAEAQGKRAARTLVTQDDVLRELRDVAMADPDAVPEDAPEAEAHEAPRPRRRESSLRYEHKLRALELLAKHLGMLKERVEHSGPDGGAVVVEVVKYGKEDSE